MARRTTPESAEIIETSPHAVPRRTAPKRLLSEARTELEALAHVSKKFLPRQIEVADLLARTK